MARVNGVIQRDSVTGELYYHVGAVDQAIGGNDVWTRTGTTLSPTTANDVVSVTISGSATAIAGTTTSGIGVRANATTGTAGRFVNNATAGGNATLYATNGDATGLIARFDNGSGLVSSIGGNGSFLATGDITINKVSGASTINFPAAFNDPGFIKHEELTADNSRFIFSVSDNDTGTDNFSFGGSPLGVYTEGARITSSGEITALNLGSKGATALPFMINSAEKGRYTAGGFFKASNNAAYYGSTGTFHEFNSDQVAGATVIIQNTSATPNGIYINYTTTLNSTTNQFIQGDENGTPRFMFKSNGGLHNYSANNVNLSDRRTKTGIEKAGSFWDVVKAIEFDKYRYKNQNSDDKRKLLGVMADQVESVYPEWVSNDGGFGKALDGTNLKSVYEQQLQYGVNIVVQESMKKIEALEDVVKKLESRIKQLENK